MPTTPAILLVEDREDDVLLFKHALEHSGLENPLRMVSDGLEALAYLNGQWPFSDRGTFPMPQIVILDLKLPKLDGWELLKVVPSRHEFDKVLVIVLTGSPRVEDLRRA